MRRERKSDGKDKLAIKSEKELEAEEVISEEEKVLVDDIDNICAFIVSNLVMLLVVF